MLVLKIILSTEIPCSEAFLYTRVTYCNHNEFLEKSDTYENLGFIENTFL